MNTALTPRSSGHESESSQSLQGEGSEGALFPAQKLLMSPSRRQLTPQEAKAVYEEKHVSYGQVCVWGGGKGEGSFVFRSVVGQDRAGQGVVLLLVQPGQCLSESTMAGVVSCHVAMVVVVVVVVVVVW